MTTKLYWKDSKLLQFSAQILDSFEQEAQSIVVLDQSAFYPTGGGQPHDVGTIGSMQVVNVTINNNGIIYHHLLPNSDFHKGASVACAVDANRRLEMTQQHTGQHILSQAFFQLFGAETRGFRINPQSSEVDLALEWSSADIPQAIRQAEVLANQIVFANRDIHTHLVSPEAASQLPLRKETFIADCVRIVEIADFDWSACGGTHARQTGEVGMIVVKHWERAKQMVRVEFLCGVRVWQDYHDAQSVADATARQFSVSRDAAPLAVAKLLEENKQLNRRNRILSAVAVRFEAAELHQNTPYRNGKQIITQVFTARSLEELKLLAHQLVREDSVITLLALRESESVRLVFARSANLTTDMGAMMREACLLISGKGGGTPDFAQGGGTNLSQLETALCLIGNKLM